MCQAASTIVKIKKNNADNEPGDLVATLTNPASLTADSLNTFTAPDVITLDANTTYWITVNEGISSNRAEFANNVGTTRPARRAGASATATYLDLTKRKAGTPTAIPC